VSLLLVLLLAFLVVVALEAVDTLPEIDGDLGDPVSTFAEDPV
jgi:hypothetical protein